MSDGRRQDADQPEAERRVDGGGRKNPLPQSEARRGNAQPKGAAAPERTPMARTLTAGGGREITIEEESGAAAAEIMIGERRRAAQADDAGRRPVSAGRASARAILAGALVAGVSAFLLGLRWRGTTRRMPRPQAGQRLTIIRRTRFIVQPARSRV
ncbi:hypothetical protein [Sphingomonas sanxanigenens]|uniref:Uncharacterized protein n=1 Tax=Sphingomonas sanxanigenens DSM 19645 = NX02 TaxID=1123269 RepID=W0AK84_9SPHN|nr:hypothetical protein [Sphingomonas sanxanigenens]AHE56075.1 hypothetical protein NX02_22260 [Sphingomonas sanxanigenens DSM 19645 = NX02]